jgi:hypothetical protein
VSHKVVEVHTEAVVTRSTDTVPLPPANQKTALPSVDKVWTVAELEAYKPKVVDKEWLLSELDIKWIATGCYILGCGGGGSPSAVYLGLRQMLRAGKTVRVVDIEKMKDNGVLVSGGGVGSPEVGEERLVNAMSVELHTPSHTHTRASSHSPSQKLICPRAAHLLVSASILLSYLL